VHGGPTIWFATTKLAWNRALPIPRSERLTSTGSSVDDVVSANTSVRPRRTIATRRIVMSTCPVTITTHSMATTSARVPSASMTSTRPATWSATAP